jgi:hypothetical protein
LLDGEGEHFRVCTCSHSSGATDLMSTKGAGIEDEIRTRYKDVDPAKFFWKWAAGNTAGIKFTGAATKKKRETKDISLHTFKSNRKRELRKRWNEGCQVRSTEVVNRKSHKIS